MNIPLDSSDLRLATCSFSAFQPVMGVPVWTTVGAARFFRYPLENIPELAPFGIFKNPEFSCASPEEMAQAYERRLEEHSETILAKLVALNEKYSGRPLVLLCFENVHKPGEYCHRIWASRWFGEKFGLDVRELSRPTRLKEKDQI